MSTNPLDEDELDAVLHPDNEAVLVAADVEDDTIVAEKVGRAIQFLCIRWTLPFRLFDLLEPGQQWLLRAPADLPSPKLPQLTPGDDLHPGILNCSHFGSKSR